MEQAHVAATNLLGGDLRYTGALPDEAEGAGDRSAFGRGDRSPGEGAHEFGSKTGTRDGTASSSSEMGKYAAPSLLGMRE